MTSGSLERVPGGRPIGCREPLERLRRSKNSSRELFSRLSRTKISFRKPISRLSRTKLSFPELFSRLSRTKLSFRKLFERPRRSKISFRKLFERPRRSKISCRKPFERPWTTKIRCRKLFERPRATKIRCRKLFDRPPTTKIRCRKPFTRLPRRFIPARCPSEPSHSFPGTRPRQHSPQPNPGARPSSHATTSVASRPSRIRPRLTAPPIPSYAAPTGDANKTTGSRSFQPRRSARLRGPLAARRTGSPLHRRPRRGSQRRAFPTARPDPARPEAAAASGNVPQPRPRRLRARKIRARPTDWWRSERASQTKRSRSDWGSALAVWSGFFAAWDGSRNGLSCCPRRSRCPRRNHCPCRGRCSTQIEPKLLQLPRVLTQTSKCMRVSPAIQPRNRLARRQLT